MMRIARCASACALVLAAACAADPPVQDAPAPAPLPAAPPAASSSSSSSALLPMPQEWAAVFGGFGAPGPEGTMMVTVQPERAIAMILVRRLPAGAPLPWHVHAGTCAAPGEAVGGAGAYPPLRPAEGGAVEGLAVLEGVHLRPDGAYLIDVHDPSTGASLACRDLRRRAD